MNIRGISTKKILKIVGIFLLAVVPVFLAIAAHELAITKGIPVAAQSCCMAPPYVPDQSTINFFLAVETGGSIIGILYTFVVAVIFWRKFWFCRKANDSMSAVYLFAALLLSGQYVLMLCWAVVFLYLPSNGYNSYIRTYLSRFVLFAGGTMDCPILLRAFDEIDITIRIVLPLSITISLIYSIFGIKRKT